MGSASDVFTMVASSQSTGIVAGTAASPINFSLSEIFFWLQNFILFYIASLIDSIYVHCIIICWLVSECILRWLSFVLMYYCYY